MNLVKKLQIGVWGLTAVAAGLALMSWGQLNRWQLAHISSYKLFPIFGMLAYSIMWAHYMAAALRTGLKVDKQKLATYFEATSIVVLVCILLHPGLLIWQLYRDGFGLPPSSYLDNYVAKGAAWAALFGSVSLAIFIVYEFHRIYDKKPWWKYVQYASDAAMVLIFFHALRLGHNLGMGWFRVVWWIYGISLLVSIGYMYKQKLKARA